MIADAAACRCSLFPFDMSGLDEFGASFEPDGPDTLEAIVDDLGASVFGPAASSSEESETEKDVIFWLDKPSPALGKDGLLYALFMTLDFPSSSYQMMNFFF